MQRVEHVLRSVWNAPFGRQDGGFDPILQADFMDEFVQLARLRASNTRSPICRIRYRSSITRDGRPGN